MVSCVSITGENIDDYIKDHLVLLFSLRKSRIKARKLAIMEAYFALYPVSGIFIKNGPLGNLKGVFSFLIPEEKLAKALSILPTIGYCNKFYLLDFRTAIPENNSDLKNINEKDLAWKGRAYSISNLFFQDKQIYKKHSADNRKFIIRQNNKDKVVYGYRGDGSEMGRRALPVEDARCMVNLSIPARTERLLVPFAGAGGIVFAAKYINNDIDVYSVDIDPVLSPGLEYYGSRHFTADSSRIRFPETYFDSLVTEVPFSRTATRDVIKSIKNLSSSLKRDGRLVLMSSIDQAPELKKEITDIGFYPYIMQKVDRKGTDVAIMGWTKSYDKYRKIKVFNNHIKSIY